MNITGPDTDVYPQTKCMKREWQSNLSEVTYSFFLVNDSACKMSGQTHLKIGVTSIYRDIYSTVNLRKMWQVFKFIKKTVLLKQQDRPRYETAANTPVEAVIARGRSPMSEFFLRQYTPSHTPAFFTQIYWLSSRIVALNSNELGFKSIWFSNCCLQNSSGLCCNVYVIPGKLAVSCQSTYKTLRWFGGLYTEALE